MSKNWYVVHTYSGFEEFVAESIKQRALELGITEEIGQIIVPKENVQEIKAGKKVGTSKRSISKGDAVKIIDGPFFNFSGIVEEVNQERSTLKVLVTIFGRSTPVELAFLQVEKI